MKEGTFDRRSLSAFLFVCLLYTLPTWLEYRGNRERHGAEGKKEKKKRKNRSRVLRVPSSFLFLPSLSPSMLSPSSMNSLTLSRSISDSLPFPWIRCCSLLRNFLRNIIPESLENLMAALEAEEVYKDGEKIAVTGA